MTGVGCAQHGVQAGKEAEAKPYRDVIREFDEISNSSSGENSFVPPSSPTFSPFRHFLEQLPGPALGADEDYGETQT